MTNIVYMSGLRSTESQSSDRMPRLEELSSLSSPGQARARGSKWGKMKEAFRWERSPVAETAGTQAEDTATCRIKQKFAQLTSSSSSCSLHSEAAYSRGEETELASSLQRSSSVADCLDTRAATPPALARRRHSLTNLKGAESGGKKEAGQQSTWIKVKNLLYNRRESLKKRSDKPGAEAEVETASGPVSATSDYEFLEDVVRVEAGSRRSKPELVLHPHPVLSQSLHSIPSTSQHQDQATLRGQDQVTLYTIIYCTIRTSKYFIF